MRRLSLSSLRVRLLLLILLAVIPALGLILYTGLTERRHDAELAQNNAMQVARLASADQERLIEGTRQLLIALSRLPQLRANDTATCAALLKDLHQQYGRLYAGLAVAAPNGDVRCSAPPARRPVNFSDRTWFQRLVHTRGFVVGEFQVGRISGKAIVVMAYPVLGAAGEVRAIVSASLDLTWLDEFKAQASLPPRSALTVIDRKGTILTRFPELEQWVGQTLCCFRRGGVYYASFVGGIMVVPPE